MQDMWWAYVCMIGPMLLVSSAEDAMPTTIYGLTQMQGKEGTGMQFP